MKVKIGKGVKLLLGALIMSWAFMGSTVAFEVRSEDHKLMPVSNTAGHSRSEDYSSIDIERQKLIESVTKNLPPAESRHLS